MPLVLLILDAVSPTFWMAGKSRPITKVADFGIFRAGLFKLFCDMLLGERTQSFFGSLPRCHIQEVHE
jgi:hypothetical protein